MPAHYVYQEPNKTTLCQGDVLRKTEALVKHLAKFHPYYANHADYKYFMVLTQSCDLVRRPDKLPTAPYITLAAVRPVEEALRREAAKHQSGWQRDARVIGARAKDRLIMFMESLLDNNKEGYFYLHVDVGTGIHQSCCAFLQLSVALKIEHYDLCLDAKIAELHEPFQAKLGYLIGHMYSRVGTAEWNTHYPDNKVGKEATSLLKRTFVTFDDKQIDEGIADLKRDGTFAEKSADDIKDYIDQKKVLSRKQKFHDQALKVLHDASKPIDMICGRVIPPLHADPILHAALDALLSGAGIQAEDLAPLRESLLEKFLERLREYLSDQKMPAKREVLEKILAKVLQDALIVKIMQ